MTASVFVGGGGIGSLTAPVAIKASGKDVLAAGTVLAEDGTVEFSIAQLRVIMDFLKDASSTRAESTADGPTTLRLKLFNFSSSLGSGTTTPMQIGTFAGRTLFLSFMVYALSEGSLRTIHYTFALGDQA